MVFAQSLIRDYDYLYDHLYLILLPKAYLLSRLFGLSFWFLIGGFCSYNILYVASLFVWIYGGYCALMLSRIWSLHRLSVPRMWGFVTAIFMLSTVLGRGARLLLIARLL